MKQATEIIQEASGKLSRDFEIGTNVLSNQTKTWLKKLDKAMEFYNLTYDQCRKAARTFKEGDFEEALRIIWGDSLDIDVNRSTNGGSTTVKTYTASDYAVYTERIEYKGNVVIHSITGRYTMCPSPGYSLGTIISFSGKCEESNIEIFDDKMTKEALSNRNTANIYNILFVCSDIHSKFLSKPMLKLKKYL